MRLQSWQLCLLVGPILIFGDSTASEEELKNEVDCYSPDNHGFHSLSLLLEDQIEELNWDEAFNLSNENKSDGNEFTDDEDELLIKPTPKFFKTRPSYKSPISSNISEDSSYLFDTKIKLSTRLPRQNDSNELLSHKERDDMSISHSLGRRFKNLSLRPQMKAYPLTNSVSSKYTCPSNSCPSFSLAGNRWKKIPSSKKPNDFHSGSLPCLKGKYTNGSKESITRKSKIGKPTIGKEEIIRGNNYFESDYIKSYNLLDSSEDHAQKYYVNQSFTHGDSNNNNCKGYTKGEDKQLDSDSLERFEVSSDDGQGPIITDNNNNSPFSKNPNLLPEPLPCYKELDKSYLTPSLRKRNSERILEGRRKKTRHLKNSTPGKRERSRRMDPYTSKKAKCNVTINKAQGLQTSRFSRSPEQSPNKDSKKRKRAPTPFRASSPTDELEDRLEELCMHTSNSDDESVSSLQVDQKSLRGDHYKPITITNRHTKPDQMQKRILKLHKTVGRDCSTSNKRVRFQGEEDN